MVAAALPVTKPSLVKAVAAMLGTELMVIRVSDGAQVPAVVGVRGLRHVGDRQRVRRGHAASDTEQNAARAPARRV